MSSDDVGSGVETTLDRDIGLLGAVSLGVGTMIAAGIFVLSGLAVANVGAMAIVAFLIAAVVASFTAFAYAEFAAIYPESGGGYAYVANTFDSNLTYIVGWSMILGYPASAAFYLASFSHWFYEFIAPQFAIQQATPYWLSGVVVLGLLVALNLKGTKETGTFQVVVTALKVALILLFLVGGLQAFDASTIQTSFFENLDQFREIGITSALVFITFFGFEAIATNAEEIESPGRTVPKAIFISMGLVTLVYTFVVLVIVLAVNDPAFLDFLRAEATLNGLTPTEFVQANGEIAMGRAAQYYLGSAGFYVIIVGALLSMLSAANATILAGSRVKLAMSRRDHLPNRFEHLHDRFNTPYNTVLLTGGLILLTVFLFTVVFGGGPRSRASLHLPLTIPLVGSSLHLGTEAIAHFADFMLLTGLIAVNVALVVSRRKYPDADRPFTVPGVPWVPIVAVLANLVLVVNVEPGAFLLGLLAEGVGVLLWFTWIAPSGPEAAEGEAPALIQNHHPAESEYEILVPIANPDHVDQLMQTARDIAADNDGAVHVLSVVQIPEQTPLSRGRKYVSDEEEVIQRAMDVQQGGGDVDVPVNGTVRIAHHVDDAILHSISQSGSDAVLVGWRGHGYRRRDVILGSTVDTVVQEADCDVLVERFGSESADFESILLPTAGGPHGEFAAGVARAIAHSTGASVEVLSIVTPDGDPTEATEALDRAREIVMAPSSASQSGEDEAVTADDDVAVETTQAEADDVADAIVERSADHDLTIIGATREGLLQQLVLGSVPEEVGRRGENTVLMVKADVGFADRIRGTLRRRED